MVKRKMTDGERIAIAHGDQNSATQLAKDIDRLLRRRMAQAWRQGHEWGANNQNLDANPYQGRKRKV